MVKRISIIRKYIFNIILEIEFLVKEKAGIFLYEEIIVEFKTKLYVKKIYLY